MPIHHAEQSEKRFKIKQELAEELSHIKGADLSVEDVMVALTRNIANRQSDPEVAELREELAAMNE